MATHFEAIREYLRHHDWVPDPRHAADDPAMEINTFLNGLVGQGLDQSPSADAGRQKKGRKVYFELDMPDAPPLSWYDQLPVPEVKRRRSIEAITTTKTFQDAHCSIAVPWPVHKATGMID
jgi:hypothetical protein